MARPSGRLLFNYKIRMRMSKHLSHFVSHSLLKVVLHRFLFLNPVVLSSPAFNLHPFTNPHTHMCTHRQMTINSLNQCFFLGYQSYLYFLASLLKCEMTDFCLAALQEETIQLRFKGTIFREGLVVGALR